MTKKENPPLPTDADVSKVSPLNEKLEKLERAMSDIQNTPTKNRPERGAFGKARRARKEEWDEHNLEEAKKNYLDAYNSDVKNLGVFKKFTTKIGHRLGIGNRGQSLSWETGDKKTDYVDSLESKLQKEALLDRYARMQKYVAFRKNVLGVRDEDVKTFDLDDTLDRMNGDEPQYKKYREYLNEADPKTRLKKLKEIDGMVMEERKSAWKTMQTGKEWYNNAIVKNGIMNKKFGLGNKFVRFGIVGTAAGIATGGASSIAWWGTRAASFVAGGLTGHGSKWLLDKIANDEKFLEKKIKLLDDQYTSGNRDEKGNVKVDVYKYQKERAILEQKINARKAIKGVINTGAAAGAGYGVRAIGTEEFFNRNIDGGTEIETPEEIEEPVIETPEEVEEPVIETPEEIEEPVIETPEEVEEPVIETPEEIEEPVVETPTYEEVKVGVSSRGSMQTFADLRQALKDAGYTPGDPNNPPAVELIFEKNNASLSKAVGYFDPSQEAESHMGHAGDEYRIKSDGRLVFFDKSAGTEVTLAGESNNTFEVTPDQNAEMFDSGKNQTEGKLEMNGSEGGNLTDENGSLEDAGVDYDPDATETSDTEKGALEAQDDRMVDTKNGKARINPNQVLNNPSNNILTAGFTDEKNPGDLPPIYNSGTPKVSTLVDNRFNGGRGPNAGGYNDNIVGGPSGVPIEGGNTLTKMLTEDNKFFDESSLTQDQVDQWDLLSEKFSRSSGGRIDSFRDVYNQMPKWKQGQIDKVLREYAGFEQNQKILEWFSWEQRSGLGKFFGRLFGNGPGKNLNINIDNDYYGGGRGGGGPIYPGGSGGGGSLPRVSK